MFLSIAQFSVSDKHKTCFFQWIFSFLSSTSLASFQWNFISSRGNGFFFSLSLSYRYSLAHWRLFRILNILLLASYQFNFDGILERDYDVWGNVECRWRIKKDFFFRFILFSTLLSDSINEIFQLAFRNCLKHWLLIYSFIIFFSLINIKTSKWFDLKFCVSSPALVRLSVSACVCVKFWGF